MRKNNWKKISLLFYVLFLSIIGAYFTSYISLPNNIIVLKDQEYELQLNKFVSVGSTNKFEIDGNKITSGKVGKESLKFNFLGNIPIRKVAINTIPNKVVVAGGETLGVRLNTAGVTILGFSEFICENGERVSPFLNSGLEKGDMIISIDDKQVNTVDELINSVQACNGNRVKINAIRGNDSIELFVTPVKELNEKKYKLGVWVREGTSGIGTLSFIEPESNSFAALGHGIKYDDNGELLKVKSGEIFSSKVITAKKGKKGEPGELQGLITNQEAFGIIEKNTEAGIFGKILINKKLEDNTTYPIALKQDIKVGKAKIICNIEGEKKEEFDIEIERVNRSNVQTNKNMVIKITDDKLLKKTGGIVQGMSGSPIIQDGKIIGVVTHVLINDPTRGYGIFIENMLKEVG